MGNGIKKMKNVKIKPEVKKGYKVSVPHSEPLVSIIATASKPEKVDRILNEVLKNAKLIVSGKEISMPLSTFTKK